MCHALLLFMGNAISGGGGGGISRKATESTRSAMSDLKMTTTTTTAADVGQLTRDVERLKAAMDEKDRTIEQLGRAVDDIRVSLTPYYYNNDNIMIVSRVFGFPVRRDVNPPPTIPQWCTRLDDGCGRSARKF